MKLSRNKDNTKIFRFESSLELLSLVDGMLIDITNFNIKWKKSNDTIIYSAFGKGVFISVIATSLEMQMFEKTLRFEKELLDLNVQRRKDRNPLEKVKVRNKPIEIALDIYYSCLPPLVEFHINKILANISSQKEIRPEYEEYYKLIEHRKKEIMLFLSQEEYNNLVDKYS